MTRCAVCAHHAFRHGSGTKDYTKAFNSVMALANRPKGCAVKGCTCRDTQGDGAT